MSRLFPEPVAPMLAKSAATIPLGDGWLYEPKWDGFRCIVIRDLPDGREEIELTSRNERPFTRYFPELVGPALEQLPPGTAVDGEIVIPGPTGLDFDALLQRIHPAASRVQRLAAETPAVFVAFDLLAWNGQLLMAAPLAQRRHALEEVLRAARTPFYLTPVSSDPEAAAAWFGQFEGAGLDGVVAKRLDAPYTPGQRTMVKVKHERTAECVVAGYRIHKDGKGVGSLLLGLFDGEGRLHHVGVAASFTVKRRAELLTELAPLLHGALDDHPWRDWAEAMAHETARLPGAQSRWNAGKDLSWIPLRVERVVEVAFSQLQGMRFRHGARVLRWRPDRTPESCTYDQLEVAAPVVFEELFSPRS
jgi:ATP-dependent DNA ligase